MVKSSFRDGTGCSSLIHLGKLRSLQTKKHLRKLKEFIATLSETQQWQIWYCIENSHLPGIIQYSQTKERLFSTFLHEGVVLKRHAFHAEEDLQVR